MAHSGFAAAFAILLSTVAFAQTPQISLKTALSGFVLPVLLTNAQDGSDRGFVVEQGGRILVVQRNSAVSSIFLDITSAVLSGGERGLLGLAFHPQYSTTGRFFVNYTRQPDGATVVSEFRVSTTDANLGNPNSEVIMLVIDQPYENHNGGMIAFGADDYLYIGMGDGGSGNDPGNRAQDINEFLGKMLRIDIDIPASETVRYSSPATNPFFGPTDGLDEIYATGFRNPWRFSFDRSTGVLHVGDVGQSEREEIDIVSSGGNYGWRVFEGTLCTEIDLDLCAVPGLIPPIAEYSHTNGRCSITGGYVYRGTAGSLPTGAYVYSDFCTGEIFMLKDGVQTLLINTAYNISSFGEDEDGEIYVVTHAGTILHIVRKFSSQITSM